MVDKSMRVLVVEDNTTMRRIVVSLVRQLGFAAVDEASDGTKALESLKEKKYGLVVSDWHMAPMTGLELLKQIRTTENPHKMVPFLMVTAESKPENILAAKQAGVSNYIVKPFNAETLKGKLVTIFGQF
jgi:two-component system chemotaxis response regulator CheY